MTDFEVKTTAKVSQQDVIDWVVTALEGGIYYWCGDLEYTDRALASEVSEANNNLVAYACPEYWAGGGKIKLLPEEDWPEGDSVLGLEELVEAAGHVRDDVRARLLDPGAYDALDADMLVQMAVFEDLVFS